MKTNITSLLNSAGLGVAQNQQEVSLPLQFEAVEEVSMEAITGGRGGCKNNRCDIWIDDGAGTVPCNNRRCTIIIV
ncbi:MAG: hypothetical protein AAFP92_22715 [Bacteroidota bacterium]